MSVQIVITCKNGHDVETGIWIGGDAEISNYGSCEVTCPYCGAVSDVAHGRYRNVDEKIKREDLS